MKKNIILPLVAVLVFAVSSQAFATVLLLHGGHVVEGEVSKVEEVYHVKTDTGEIRISANRVELVFDGFEDVYCWKRSLIRVGCHSDHVELARWCLKYDLLDLAQRELVAAELAEPGTAMVDYLQRRLTSKRNVNTSETPRPFTPLPEAKPVPETTPQADCDETETISLETLDQATSSISPNSMAQFASTIQPILLNNCATGGCHVGAGDEKMKLYRSGLAGKAGRRTTQRNLYAVLEWLNTEQPDFSPLLTVPLRPHGKTAPAMIEGHKEEYQRLVYWAFQISREQKAKVVMKNPYMDRAVKPAMHTESATPDESIRPEKSIVQETLDMIPPEGAKLQKKGKDGRLEPVYPSDNVTSTSPFRKALAVNPSLLKAFLEKEKEESR